MNYSASYGYLTKEEFQDMATASPEKVQVYKDMARLREALHIKKNRKKRGF